MCVKRRTTSLEENIPRGGLRRFQNPQDATCGPFRHLAPLLLLLLLLLRGRGPARPRRSPVRPPRPTRIHPSRSLGLLFLEAAEAPFLLRMHEMNCPHG